MKSSTFQAAIALPLLVVGLAALISPRVEISGDSGRCTGRLDSESGSGGGVDHYFASCLTEIACVVPRW